MRRVDVDGFWIDERPVTAAEFRRFVRETGYVTVAERAARPRRLSRCRSRPARARLARFPQDSPAPCRWTTHATGGSTCRARSGRNRAGRARRSTAATGIQSCRLPTRTRRLSPPGRARSFPTEAEWEYAARGGLEGATFAWGDEHFPNGDPHGKYLAGGVSVAEPESGRLRGNRRPSAAFQPNGFGLYDVCGNVWEWTSDWFTSTPDEKPCCAPPVRDGERFPRKVIKGGSHLARRTTAFAIAPRPGRARPWTPRPRISASAASLEVERGPDCLSPA